MINHPNIYNMLNFYIYDVDLKKALVGITKLLKYDINIIPNVYNYLLH